MCVCVCVCASPVFWLVARNRPTGKVAVKEGWVRVGEMYV